MFIYEAIEHEWVTKLKKYNFKEEIGGKSSPLDYWCIDHKKQEALLYISFVSSAIVRCDGQDYWKFAFFIKDICIIIEAEVFGYAPTEAWDKRNRIKYSRYDCIGLSYEELTNDIISAMKVFFKYRNRQTLK